MNTEQRGEVRPTSSILTDRIISFTLVSLNKQTQVERGAAKASELD